MKKVRLGLAGFGTVGTGLARIIEENGEWIERRVGKGLEIGPVLVRDLSKKRVVAPGPAARFTDSVDDLLSDESVDIVVELMGGIDTAYDLITRALTAGKHVVTANKHLLAKHGCELFELAAKNGLALAYEASVAGGIPVIEPLREGLAGNRITKLVGILNGTANYILSEMTTGGLEFDTALSQAQDLGYAEADPTFDIEGFDAAHKLVVLIRLAFGEDYPLDELPIRGITSVTGQDIRFAREFGYRIKLIAQVTETGGRLEAGVFPALVKYTYLLARVGGNYNAVRLEGNAVGPVMLHGQGAGALPTGSAVIGDILDICRHMDAPGWKPDNTGFGNAPLERADILSPDLALSEHYFRFSVADETGVMATIARSMADNGISIAQAVQKEVSQDGVSVVFITHEAEARNVRKCIEEIDAMSFTLKPTVHFRIL